MNPYRNDFPFFQKHPGYVYLDSATTSQKPAMVIRTLHDFYAYEYASAQRSMYAKAEEATIRYEEVRQRCARFINASSAQEILFTKSATESINIVASGWASHVLKEGDEIILSRLEHTANSLPWLLLAQEKKCVIRWWDFDNEGHLSLSALNGILTSRTKLLAVTGYSNVMGAVAPHVTSFLKRLVQVAHTGGARVLIDASQLAPHIKVNVQDIKCDFMAFSAHKMLGPQGVGVLYAQSSVHDEFHPCHVGGGMLASWTEEGFRFQSFPRLYEAGTQGAAQVIAYGKALEYLEHVDFDWLQKHESLLCNELKAGLEKLPGIHVLGPVPRAYEDHLVSFTVAGIHPHDVAAYLDSENIAVRAGKQCAEEVHKKLGINASIRASFYLYSTHEEVQKLLIALRKLVA